MNFVKITRKSFPPLSLSCRGVTDAMPGACNIDKSGNSQDNLIVKCLGSHTNIVEFNQSKVCGEKSSTSGISLWFTYLLSNKKPRYLNSIAGIWCIVLITFIISFLLTLYCLFWSSHPFTKLPLRHFFLRVLSAFSLFLQSHFFSGSLLSPLRLVHMLHQEKKMYIEVHTINWKFVKLIVRSSLNA